MGENVCAGHSIHRGAWRARRPFTAFQSKCALQSNESVVGAPWGEGPRWEVSSSVPHLAPHSPLGQEALDPQGSHVTQEGRLSQGDRQDLGHPKSRTIDEFLSDAQDQGRWGLGGLPLPAPPGVRLEQGRPGTRLQKEPESGLDLLTGRSTHRNAAHAHTWDARSAGWLRVGLGDRLHPSGATVG